MMERQQSYRYGAFPAMTARAASYGRFALAAIAAAVVFSVGLGGVAGADASGAVTVRSWSLASEFPEGFRVRLTASSDEDIESVAIRVRIGRHTRTGYDYLEITRRDGSLEGDLLWRTNTAASYIPPGTVITYSFEFVDSDGRRYETEKAEFVYHDPRFVWKEISRGPITVAYHGGSEPRAREILDTMLLTLDRMAPLLGADREEPIRLTVYNSGNEMRRAIAPAPAALPVEQLEPLPGRLRGAQALFDPTGGIHAAGIFTADGQRLCVREDVGRHNAVDKVIGHFVLRGAVPLRDHILVVSGRAG
ncbi:MAG: formate dehydrogenase accessory sulfurtransferase FdhD, partial [Chloroflexota bacterium]|nr:formate dehydrogenase accessory sulfurtransferase FdhD [Chloroflexota bacterium]